MKSDLEIAQSSHLQKIEDVAKKINITQDALVNFGSYMAKINLKELRQAEKKDGKLILVTAMSPTPAGEGKTTTTIGLTDAIASADILPIAITQSPLQMFYLGQTKSVHYWHLNNNLKLELYFHFLMGLLHLHLLPLLLNILHRLPHQDRGLE